MAQTRAGLKKKLKPQEKDCNGFVKLKVSFLSKKVLTKVWRIKNRKIVTKILFFGKAYFGTQLFSRFAFERLRTHRKFSVNLTLAQLYYPKQL